MAKRKLFTVYYKKEGRLTQDRIYGTTKRDAISRARLKYKIHPRTKIEAYEA